MIRDNVLGKVFLSGFLFVTTLLMTPLTTYVLDFTQIYNEDYQYLVPEGLLKEWFQGKGFDFEPGYSANEILLVENDAENSYQNILSHYEGDEKNRIVIISAGAPGTGKTMLLESLLRNEVSSFSYIDPDEMLKNMSGYREHLAEYIDLARKLVVRQAYNKWRPASNFVAHWCLANVIRDGQPFYYGTTASGPKTSGYFHFLKSKGYRIELVHVSAPDSVRLQSVADRDNTFYQTTEIDVIEKGQLIYQRINDSFFQYADKISFYWRDEFNKAPILTAIWKRDSSVIQVLDKAGFDQIKGLHGKHWPEVQEVD